MAQRRIVIVEDDSIIRMDLRNLLQRMDYLVVAEAADGQSAISLARELRPDLVIMDIKLSGTPDGIAAAAAITAEQIAPVLLLSGFADVELVRRAAEAGVAGYLLKPFSEEELRPAIEIRLARFQELRALTSETADLRDQLETRKIVERAKGVLMQQYQLSEPEAFNRIQKASMNSRKPMRSIAEAIILAQQISP